MKLRRISMVIAFLMSFALIIALAQGPGDVTRSGQNLYRTQDAHDTDQDRRLYDLEQWRQAETAIIQDVRDKQTYQIGGLAGFGVLLTWLQIVQLRKMK